MRPRRPVSEWWRVGAGSTCRALVAVAASSPAALPDGHTACAGGELATATNASPPVAQDPGGEGGESADSDADSGASALPYAPTNASTDVLWPNGEVPPREPTAPWTPMGSEAYDTDSDASFCRNCTTDLDDPPGTECGVCHRRRYCLACTPRCYNTGCLIDVCFDCYDEHEVSCPFLPDPEDEMSF